MRYCFFLAALVAAPTVFAQTATDLDLEAPDGTTVAIDRDDFGVPHITADTESAVFFGQGFATAQDRLFQLETFWRAATGRLAELQGPNLIGQDQAVRTVFYTPDERADQFDDLSPRLQTMISSYVDGINAYIDSTSANPTAYLPGEYAAAGFQPEPYSVDKAMAVMQFFIRRFGEIGGQELARLAELQAEGSEWFNENRPVNDPAASVTIEASSQAAPPFGTTYAGPPVDPAIALEVEARRDAVTQTLIENGVPHKFGSFAAVISQAMSETGNVLLLGAPQMGAPSVDAKAVTAEYELLVGSPDGDGLHVAGMSVPGIPGVIIGRTRGRAWTFTTGVTDNTDTYTLTLGPPTDQGVPTYLYDGEFKTAQAVTSTINVGGGDPVTYTSFRTEEHGPVYSIDAENGRAYAYKYAFWNRELVMAEALLDAWDAESIETFQDAAARIPVSFNMFYADQDQNIAFWHVGQYPIRPGDADPRLPLQGDGSQEWLGLTEFAQQPQSVNPSQGYFANWNNKPVAWWNQGDNVSWTDTPPDGRLRVFDGVDFLKEHLEAAGQVSFEEIQELTRVIRTNPDYPEYPATYQQVIEFSPNGSYAENVIPPGQSGFIDVTGTPSDNFADQWALYQSSAGEGEIEMKPFTFLGARAVAQDAAPDLEVGLGSPYPNPAASAVTLPIQLAGPVDLEVAVFDALGRR
ncbi:penicillin acylase family protein, partial [Rubrivirga sp.]|uniref:penicillin acylase family protein n=1 Tax=Rubrivirga sp. TaxID=1885344 RepID=UPI003C756285